MMDSLKRFIDSNRDRFDDREPSDNDWRKIEKSLSQPIKNWWNAVGVWRAAAILLFGVSAYLIGSRQATSVRPDVNLASEFKDLDTFYNNQIMEKFELVSQLQRENADTKDDVTQSLQKLEAMYLVLKEEMKKRPTQDVKDALILNLLVRIDLLNQRIQKLDHSGAERQNHKSI